jgi:hypothetical protein
MAVEGITMRTASDVKALRGKLIRKAYQNPEMRPALLPKIAQLSQDTMRVAGMDLPVHVALDLQAARLAAGPLAIERMPGFSGMQLRQQIDRLGAIQREVKIINAQYEAVMKQLAGLEKEEKAGLDLLKKAAGEMRDKGKYAAEAETALLEFTTYLTEKRPGIEQMIASPTDAKWGDKAGDFFGRIAAKLGDEVAKAVEGMYEATKEDLTHTVMAVKGLKVVQKTAGMDAAIVKQAGLSDMIVGVKEWLAGKARSFMGFMGDIGRWFKGFVERTKLVKESKDNLKSSIAKAKGDINKMLASNK